MKKALIDLHTHSRFSFDAEDDLATTLATACQKGVAFYGVAEHLDFDAIERGYYEMPNVEEYFHTARHLQEDYEGAMNVAVGMELGFCRGEEYARRYSAFCEAYHPDYIVNSVHAFEGEDYYNRAPFFDKTGALKSKKQAYREYFECVRASLDAPYPYDIVGHIGYCTRYAPYADREATLAELQEQIDDILLKIIELGKILEINSSNKGGVSPFLPSREILKRYYALGGRSVSFGSDAHSRARIADKYEEAVALLKELGFTYWTVPFRGERYKVEF